MAFVFIAGVSHCSYKSNIFYFMPGRSQSSPLVAEPRLPIDTERAANDQVVDAVGMEVGGVPVAGGCLRLPCGYGSVGRRGKEAVSGGARAFDGVEAKGRWVWGRAIRVARRYHSPVCPGLCGEGNYQRDLGVQVGNGTTVGIGMSVSVVLLDSSLSSIEESASTTATYLLRALMETTTVVDAPAFRPSTVTVTASFSRTVKLPASPPPTFLTWAVISTTWNGKVAPLETMQPSPHTIPGFDFNRASIAMTKSGNGVG